MACLFAVLLLHVIVFANAGEVEEIWKLNFGNDKLPDVVANEGETTLLTLAKTADIATSLATKNDITLFGPTNTAFEALPIGLMKYLEKNKTALAKVLKYHVTTSRLYSSQLKNDLMVPTLNGEDKIRINVYRNGRVITASGRPIMLNKVNINASNGVLHKLTRVMLPPVGGMVQALSKCPVFKTLTTLIKESGLTTKLTGPGPFTMFAPTDTAFSKLSKAMMDDLHKNKKKLIDVLTYHVMNGTFYSAGLTSGSVKTMNGENVKIEVTADGIKVNEADVLMRGADVTAVNGVVHTIQSVLMPTNANHKLKFVNSEQNLLSYLMQN